jgi:hypothetical protein
MPKKKTEMDKEKMKKERKA